MEDHKKHDEKFWEICVCVTFSFWSFVTFEKRLLWLEQLSLKNYFRIAVGSFGWCLKNSARELGFYHLFLRSEFVKNFCGEKQMFFFKKSDWDADNSITMMIIFIAKNKSFV